MNTIPFTICHFNSLLINKNVRSFNALQNTEPVRGLTNCFSQNSIGINEDIGLLLDWKILSNHVIILISIIFNYFAYFFML